jgi:hypothetical protein|nr:MAG TPA: alpha-aminoadipate carrier protein [Caudoviricetes sp.]
MLKILDIKYRKEPIKHTKLQHFEEKNNLVKRKADKLYDYYICDNCGSEIRLDIKQTERSGGIAILPNSLTKCGELKVVLCNKCVKDVLKQLEK